MKNTDKKFITTFDEIVANKLKLDGYSLLSEMNGQYLFINNGTLKFSENENVTETIKKMHYTNVLCMAE